MGFRKTLYYVLCGKKISDKQVKVIDLKKKITRLSSVYVEIAAYKVIKHEHSDSTVKKLGSLTEENLKGEEAYSIISDFILERDYFNWESTSADLILRRIKNKKKKTGSDLLDIVILSDVTFNIQIEGELDEIIISSLA